MLTEVNNSAPTKKAIALPKRKARLNLNCFIVVLDNQILISQIEEVAPEEEGHPNCRLVQPFVIIDTVHSVLAPYLVDYTNDNQFKVHSSKFITLAKPNATLLAKYESLVLE
jgi:hypothetical protein